MNVRARLYLAVEALEAGDLWTVGEILLALIDDVGYDGQLHPLRSERHHCPEPNCRMAFEWPGLLDRHRIVDHGLAEAA